MRKRKIDELISRFNCKVAEMDISRECRFELLGMITAIGIACEKELNVEPERKTGKWIRHPEWEADGECGYECDQCGMGSDVDYNFCMRCGAKMEE